MYCSNCGQQLSDGATFCSNCGTKQSEKLPENNASSPVATAAQRPVTYAAAATPQPIIVNVNNVNSNKNENRVGGGIDYPYKRKWPAFFLCLFFGVFGIHRFYVGKVGTGIIWLCTGGLAGVGWFIDLLSILFGAYRDKAGYPLR